MIKRICYIVSNAYFTLQFSFCSIAGGLLKCNINRMHKFAHTYKYGLLLAALWAHEFPITYTVRNKLHLAYNSNCSLIHTNWSVNSPAITSWNNMAFQCATTCSNFVIIAGLNSSFWVSSLRCVCFRELGSSPNRISELVSDSDSEEAGASSDVIYLDNSILCIFRQPLKYLCFSYSFLDGLRKYHVETLDSSLWKIYWKWWCKSVEWDSTQ